MPPNNSSRFTNKTTDSKSHKTKVPCNSVAIDARFNEESFTVIQYAIHSLIGRPTDGSPSPVAERFLELVSEILEKHEVYNHLCSNLDITPSNLTLNFDGVAESIFEDNHINWGRLIALVGFSVKVAEYLRNEGYNNQDNIVVELTSNFIVDRTGTWIVARGGWNNVVSHFANTRGNTGQFTPQNESWFKGILVTATATLGLGALLAVTCK